MAGARPRWPCTAPPSGGRSASAGRGARRSCPWSLLAIVTVPAIINVGVGYLTRDTPAEGFEFITYREYVGVSTAPAAVRRPDRARRRVPRPTAPCPAADLRPAARRAGTTCWPRWAPSPRSSSASASSPRWCCSSARCWSATPRSTTSATTPRCSGRCPLAVVLLAVYYAAIGVAIASLTSRRIVAGVAILALALVPSVDHRRGAGQRRRRAPARSASSTCSPCRSTCGT